MNPAQWLSMNNQTPYSILGLEKYQGQPINCELLCKHYMKSSEIYHPDKLITYGHLSQQKINEAYSRFCAAAFAFYILENPTFKSYYDQTGNYLNFEQDQTSSDQNPWLMHSQSIWRRAKNDLDSLTSIPSSMKQPNNSFSPSYNGENTNNYKNHQEPIDLTNRIKRSSPKESEKQKTKSPKSGTSKIGTPRDKHKDFIKKDHFKHPIKALFTVIDPRKEESQSPQLYGHSNKQLGNELFLNKNNLTDDSSENFFLRKYHAKIPNGPFPTTADSKDKADELTELYELTHQQLHDETELNENDLIDSDDVEENQDFIDYSHPEIDLDELLGGSYYYTDDSVEDSDYIDDNEDMNENDDVSIDDENSYVSEFVPLDFEDLARHTKEKQYLRGRELVKKFDQVISGNKDYRLPSEDEFAAIQKQLVKRQKKTQLERDQKEVKKTKRTRNY
ncbi:unnamed protein product [Cunninghamella blakesleeana]